MKYFIDLDTNKEYVEFSTAVELLIFVTGCKRTDSINCLLKIFGLTKKEAKKVKVYGNDMQRAIHFINS